MLDQSQPTADASAPFTVAVGGTYAQKVAQLFTAGVSGRLREGELPVACAAGQLEVEIRDVVAGVPGHSILATERIAATRIAPFVPGVASFHAVSLLSASRLVAGAQYAIVVDSRTRSCGLLPGPVGDPKAGGSALTRDLVNGPTWVSLALGYNRDDLLVFTYMRERSTRVAVAGARDNGARPGVATLAPPRPVTHLPLLAAVRQLTSRPWQLTADRPRRGPAFS